MFGNFSGLLAVQAMPSSGDYETLLLWALGLVVAFGVTAMTFLVKQIQSYQKRLEAKDQLIQKMNEKFLAEITVRNEKHSELINSFTKALLDNSEKLDHLPNHLAQSLTAGFSDIKKDFINHTNELMLKAIKGELDNGKANK